MAAPPNEYDKASMAAMSDNESMDIKEATIGWTVDGLFISRPRSLP